MKNKSRFSDIIFEYPGSLHLISCYFAIAELFKHQEKMVKVSKLPAEKLSVLLYGAIKKIEFYNEDTIDVASWQEADHLTKGVDSKDITFVALALQTGGLLWTGDKKLTDHLRKMGFNNVVNTSELYEILNIK